MGSFRVSDCPCSGLKRKIAMIFAGNNKNLISNSDLPGKRKTNLHLKSYTLGTAYLKLSTHQLNRF